MINTKLTDEYARSIFGNVLLNAPFEALLRAAVLENGDDPEKAKCSGRPVYADSDETMKECIFGGQPQFVLSKAQDFKIESVKGIVEKAKEDGWTTFDDAPIYLDKYLSQWTKTAVFVHKEKRLVRVLTERTPSETWYRALCSVMFKLFPWYYPETKETFNFFKSIAISKDVSLEDFERIVKAYVNGVAEAHGFEDMRLHAMLDGFADKARTTQIESLSAELDAKTREIDRYNAMLVELYEQYDRVSLSLSALRALGTNADDVWYRFFNQRKDHINIIRIANRNTIEYEVTGDLVNYDRDELEKDIENPHSYFHDHSDETIQYVCKAILLEGRGRIRQSGCFRLSSLRLVEPISGCKFVADAMPNQHIYVHGCNGGNGTEYSRYAQEGDWQMGIDQSAYAVTNLNIGDSTVVGETLRWLPNNDDVKCIWVTDGSPLGDDHLPEDARLVSYREFKEIVKKKYEEENA